MKGFLCGLGATLLLSAAALYNGYPLVYYDSGGYIGYPLAGEISWARPPVYGLLILPLHQLGSLWTVVFAQSALIAYLLHLTTRVVLGRPSPAVLLGSASALTLLSALPWHTGQVMADIFTPMVVLVLFLLGCAVERLSPLERVLLVSLGAVAIATHFSHVLLAGVLLVPLLSLLATRFRRVPDPWTRLGLLLLPLLLSIPLHVGGVAWLGSLYRDGPTLSHVPIRISDPTTWAPYSRLFPLARFMAMGPGKRYLDEECPRKQFALCPYRDHLPSTAPEFLFSPDSPVRKIGGVESVRAEAAQIVAGSLAAEPIWHLRLAASGALLQLTRFQTGDNLHPYLDSDSDGGQWVPSMIRRAVPQELPRYLASRQNTGRLPLARIRRVHRLAFLLSLPLALACFAGALWRGHSAFVALGLVLSLALLANAFVTGAISAPEDRYQSRVAWFVIWYVVLGAATLRRPPGHQSADVERARPNREMTPR